MSKLDKMLLGTGNAGKVREVTGYMRDLPLEVVTLDDVFDPRPPEPAEDGDTFLANAVIKATYYARLAGIPCLADDSGLCLDALNGFPGVYAHRFAITEANPDPSDADRNEALVRILNEHGLTESSASYQCAVALVAPDGSVMLQAQRSLEGMFRSVPSGTNGFSFDPFFYVKRYGYKRTCADLTLAEKNSISHRGRALAAIRDGLAAML